VGVTPRAPRQIRTILASASRSASRVDRGDGIVDDSRDVIGYLVRQENTLPGIVTILTVEHASSVRRSVSVSPPSPFSACATHVGTPERHSIAAWSSPLFSHFRYSRDGGGRAVFEVVNNDITHVFALMIPGALLALVGQVLQAVGLFRAKVVPVWVPWLSLAIVPTFVIPGNGLTGLVTGVPMAAAAAALGYYAWRRYA
jgi:hypothetical protein